jgi:hypothetical protein
MVLAVASSSAPPIAWVIVIAIVVISFITSIVKGIGSAGTALAGLKTLKSVVGDGQLLAGRPTTGSLRLSGPVDLVGQNLATGLITDPLMVKVSTMIGMIQLARQGGGKTIPRQYATDRLVAKGAAGSLALAAGFFIPTELHARALSPGPAGDRMVVWYKGRLSTTFGLSGPSGGTFTEYWTFVSAGPAPTLPVQCPNCGAPTSGITSYVCPFCNTTLWQAPPDAPSYWLVDDISSSPPPELAAAA